MVINKNMCMVESCWTSTALKLAKRRKKTASSSIHMSSLFFVTALPCHSTQLNVRQTHGRQLAHTQFMNTCFIVVDRLRSLWQHDLSRSRRCRDDKIQTMHITYGWSLWDSDICESLHSIEIAVGIFACLTNSVNFCPTFFFSLWFSFSFSPVLGLCKFSILDSTA